VSRRLIAASRFALSASAAERTMPAAERTISATQRAVAEAESPTDAPSSAFGTSAPIFSRRAISAAVAASRARVCAAPSAMRWSANNTCTQHSTASRRNSMKFTSSRDGVESP